MILFFVRYCSPLKAAVNLIIIHFEYLLTFFLNRMCLLIWPCGLEGSLDMSHANIIGMRPKIKKPGLHITSGVFTYN